MERDFKGVWFPSSLWLDKSLKPLHKMFLLECDSLNNPKTGCYASNSHFSEMFGVTKGRCSQIIRDLERDKWITIKLIYDGKQIKKRVIRVVNALNRGSKNIKLPYLENAQGSNNNKAVITKDIHTPAKKDFILPKNIDKSLWDEWMQIRSRLKAVNSDRAKQMLLTELDKCVAEGIDANKAIDIAISKSWKSINPQWITNLESKHENSNSASSKDSAFWNNVTAHMRSQ